MRLGRCLFTALHMESASWPSKALEHLPADLFLQRQKQALGVDQLEREERGLLPASLLLCVFHNPVVVRSRKGLRFDELKAQRLGGPIRFGGDGHSRLEPEGLRPVLVGETQPAVEPGAE